VAKLVFHFDYIRGFYIGDGCISISLNTKRDPNDYSAKFYRWKQTSGKSNMNIFRLQPRFWFFERKGKIRFKSILRFHGIPLKIHYDVYFSLAGDYYTQSLFEAVHSTFGAGNIGAKPEDNSSVYQLRGWEKAKNIVFPFLDNQDLPTFRQKQFQIFKAALAAYRGQTYKNLKNTKKLLVLLHDMNQGGKYRRQSKSTALYNFRKFFKLRKK
jgi:hypothetical protein